ncbi:MAG: ribosome recycling factor [Armatimonadetes bacterium]|nr:ribosome recycling factor [Armatimonadota bacterium]
MEDRMKKTLESVKKELSSIRTGRASPTLLDRIKVECYGTDMDLKQIANISSPEAKLLIIQPWDKSQLSNIEKAILKSDLGINPVNDGNIIRLGIPPLTEERRKELVKIIRRKIEEGKIVLRNIRRDVMEDLKNNQGISEDQLRRGESQVQKITDKFIKELEEIESGKEKEIMEV